MDTPFAMLFPHSCLPETGIKQILSFSGPLTICEPWFLERPVFLSEMERRSAVQVLRPPESMNPGEGFVTLLNEYRGWSQSHRDRGYRDFLKAIQGHETDEESSWAIRQSLLDGGQALPGRDKDQALKSHIILHLARDIDDQRYEADSLLGTLKQTGSPLSGIVEEEPQSPIADLPRFQGEPLIEPYAQEQVLEAWVTLFAAYMKRASSLFTINRQVLDCVRDRWEEESGGAQAPGPASISLPWPDFSRMDAGDLLAAREDLQKDGAARSVMEAIGHPQGDPGEQLDRLDAASREMKGIFEGSPPWGRLLATVLPIPPLAGGGSGDGLLRPLAGKTLVLVEGE